MPTPVNHTRLLQAALSALAILGLALAPVTITFSSAQAAGDGISTWWPLQGAHMDGTQPFKALVEGRDPNSYEMFWQVDGGVWNWMDTNYQDAPHKEAQVDVSDWNWRGSGPYKVNFIARQNGKILTERAVEIYVDGAQPTAQAQPNSAPVQEAAKDILVVPATDFGNALSGLRFYVNPNAPAKAQANEWRSSRPDDAKKMDYLAAQPTAQWLGGWNADVGADVAKVVNAAKSVGQVPVFVAYNVPGRDCGGYSAGGVGSRDAYGSWIQAIARGIGGASAVVILEPDALAGITCLSGDAQQARIDMLSSAIATLKGAGAKVYLDAGHSSWVDATTMAGRLAKAGIAKADGFALNVSNFQTTSAETAYGEKLSSMLGGKHFVIDTARNGAGSNGEWCNPSGRTIGQQATTNTGNALVDAYLWLKVPGESDGNCNGGPSAGVWWPEYALSLMK